MIDHDRERVRTRLSERDRLQQLNRRLSDFLRKPRPRAETPEAHGWASSLSQRLTELHESVSRDFRKEQDNRTLAQLGERYPRAADRLQNLFDEQGRILENLRGLVDASMSYAEARKPEDPKLRERTRNLLGSMARRDAAETALIQDLVSTDVGAGG
ncbi:MAG: hypothetical protein GY716_03715 [bacterium]|nr:hypothetical protein [bacterium]